MSTKPQQHNQVNLWPSAIILFITFILLVTTGVVIFFGVVQQLRYISWERSLRETESSLAAQKELLTLSRKAFKLIYSYNQSPSLEILQELEQNLVTRQALQQNLIQTDPALITQTLLPAENLDQLSETLQKYAETKISISALIQSKLKEISGYHYYDISTSQGAYVLISSTDYPLNSTISISGHFIFPSYIVEE